MINELPYKLRIKKENILLAGLWFGSDKPAPNSFMNSFTDDLKKLYRGVDFEIPETAELLRVRAMLITGTCDLCAKALFLNVKQSNSAYGCPTCKIRTRRIDNVSVYAFDDFANLELRTTENSKQLAIEAYENDEALFGVKGPTTLSVIAHRYVESTANDKMHCISGHVKKLIAFWFDADYRVHGFSLFQYVNLVNARIKSLKLPSFVSRTPRSVTDYAYWKGRELELFLVVTSLPILHNIMDPIYFEHFSLLVTGITILNSSSILNEQIDEAHRVLEGYVSRFEYLYGLRHMTCNLHLIRHLPDDVRKFGPIYFLSCYPFENLNGILKGYVHGSRHPELQITSAVSTFLNLAEIEKKYLRVDSAAWRFCRRIDKSGTHRHKTRHLSNKIYAVGAFTKTNFVPDIILETLRVLINDGIDTSKCHIYHKLLKDGIFYETELYVKNKKTNSTLVKYEHNNEIHYGILHCFITLCKCECGKKCNECNDDCQSYAIINQCEIEKAFACNFEDIYVPNMYTCAKIPNQLLAIDLDSIVHICYYFMVENIYYVTVPCNLDEEIRL